MGKNERFGRMNAKYRWTMPSALLILGITSLQAWVGVLPRSMLGGKARADIHEAIVVADTNNNSPDQSSDTPPAPSTIAPWNMHLYAVPFADGTSLFISTGQTAELEASITAEVAVGGAMHVHGMTYVAGEQAYQHTFPGILTAGSALAEGTIGLSAKLDGGGTLDTGPTGFRRFRVAKTDETQIVSDDNLMEITIFEDSLPHGLLSMYVAVVSANSAPGPILPGHRIVSKPYSARAQTGIYTTTKPMSFKLFYTDTTLGDVDPHTLSILRWNPSSKDWHDLGGNLDDWIEHSVSTATDRFAVHALMATTRWRDGFNDLSGLSEREHTEILLLSSELILDGKVLTGTAVSRPITPTVSIGEWGTVTCTMTEPAGTNLTVDVLDVSDSVVLSDVADGTSLAALDPALYPSLKLRASLTTDDLAVTPRLDEWSITWQPRICKTYLPLVLR